MMIPSSRSPQAARTLIAAVKVTPRPAAYRVIASAALADDRPDQGVRLAMIGYRLAFRISAGFT
jgi:hypothetical protein